MSRHDPNPKAIGAVILVIATLFFVGCSSPDAPAEPRAAQQFCLAQRSQVESVHLWRGSGEGFKVECKNGAVAE